MDRRGNNFNMRTVSIVVPVYYGQKYIAGLIKQAEAEKELLEPEDSVELILVNDAPDDPLPTSYDSELIEITVLNTEHNRGIQGARVYGIECCRGQYVHMLDQDDRIAPDFLQSQLRAIDGYDASVCRAIHDKKQVYTDARPFESVSSLEYMLSQGDAIVSPGQVLIKKESISQIWKENHLKYNGADDWLLWICMLAEGKRFARNDKVLYEHVVDGENNSWQSEEMMRSEQEVLEVLKREHVLGEVDIKKLTNTLLEINIKRIANIEKFRTMFFICNLWLTLKNKNKSVYGYLQENGFYKIAIYGNGYLGKQLYEELKIQNVYISYFIDRDAAYMDEEVPVYTLEDELETVDIIIVTLTKKDENFRKVLTNKAQTTVWYLEDLLNKVLMGE